MGAISDFSYISKVLLEKIEDILSYDLLGDSDRALCDVLLLLQEEGALTEEVVPLVANLLSLPENSVWQSIASSPLLSLETHTVQICDGSLCALMAPCALISAAKHFVQQNDLSISVKKTMCLGECEYAPVVKGLKQTYGNVNAKSLCDLLQKEDKDAKE
ncbi:MAG: NAD(P)H-dependent oxidoreductase subunit E [Alphaproteobacteria bacterium]|nr:NAD(P)H-dependent oxidoreductase subunit E [Alphaproteobacteria bacterium]